MKCHKFPNSKHDLDDSFTERELRTAKRSKKARYLCASQTIMTTTTTTATRNAYQAIKSSALSLAKERHKSSRCWGRKAKFQLQQVENIIGVQYCMLNMQFLFRLESPRLRIECNPFNLSMYLSQEEYINNYSHDSALAKSLAVTVLSQSDS